MSKIVVSKATTLTIIIPALSSHAKRERIDRILRDFPSLPSRSQIQRWFDEGRILLEGKTALKPSSKVREGDKIIVIVPQERKLNLEARPMPLEIFHEDEDLLVIYKPKGISMHPGAAGKDETTLVHGLLHHSDKLSKRGGDFRPGIVHRLDKETEGIVVIAKNNRAHDHLALQFKNRTMERAYWALCYGRVPRTLTIDQPIGRHPKDRKKMAIVMRGKPSHTEVELIQYFDAGYSWVRCRLKTGRTHQIRVHLTSKGFPLLGDRVYGRPRKISYSAGQRRALDELQGQALVAYQLGFAHPRTEKWMHFEVKAPEWLRQMTQMN